MMFSRLEDSGVLRAENEKLRSRLSDVKSQEVTIYNQTGKHTHTNKQTNAHTQTSQQTHTLTPTHTLIMMFSRSEDSGALRAENEKLRSRLAQLEEEISDVKSQEVTINNQTSKRIHTNKQTNAHTKTTPHTHTHTHTHAHT